MSGLHGTKLPAHRQRVDCLVSSYRSQLATRREYIVRLHAEAEDLSVMSLAESRLHGLRRLTCSLTTNL